MASAPGYLIDTNILLRLFRKVDPLHQLIKGTLSGLNGQGCGLYFSLQNIAEFWNVCTRPTDRNGFGLTDAETNKCVDEIERNMTFLPDNQQVYSNWRQLVVAYGVTRILTMNQQDFLRYPAIQAVHPGQVQTSPQYP